MPKYLLETDSEDQTSITAATHLKTVQCVRKSDLKDQCRAFKRAIVSVCSVAHSVYLWYLASGALRYCPFSRLFFLCGGGGGIRPPVLCGDSCAVSILNTCSASASLPQPCKRREIRDSSQKHGPERSLRAAWSHLIFIQGNMPRLPHPKFITTLWNLPQFLPCMTSVA